MDGMHDVGGMDGSRPDRHREERAGFPPSMGRSRLFHANAHGRLAQVEPRPDPLFDGENPPTTVSCAHLLRALDHRRRRPRGSRPVCSLLRRYRRVTRRPAA